MKEPLDRVFAIRSGDGELMALVPVTRTDVVGAVMAFTRGEGARLDSMGHAEFRETVDIPEDGE